MSKPEAKPHTDPNTATVTHGSVTLSLPVHVNPPEKAFKMTAEEVKRIPKVQLGIGLACAQAADSGEKAGAKFTWPAGVTPASLRSKGQRAEDVDNVINDVEVILAGMKKANLLFDADAWDELRQVNDQVKAQGKRNPELLTIFKPLVEYLAKAPRTPAPVAPATEGTPTIVK